MLEYHDEVASDTASDAFTALSEEFTGAMFLVDVIENEYNDIRVTRNKSKEELDTAINILFWQYAKGVEAMAKAMELNGCFTTGLSREDPLHISSYSFGRFSAANRLLMAFERAEDFACSESGLPRTMKCTENSLGSVYRRIVKRRCC